MNSIFSGALLMLLSIISGSSELKTFKNYEDDVKIIIQGTSSLHDWEMDLKKVDCTVGFITDSGLIKNISNISFSCKARDIKSDYSLMDKKTYDALKADRFPQIRFNQTIPSKPSKKGNEFIGSIEGNLNVGGETRKISVHYAGEMTEKGMVSVKGSVNINMSDFNITPPSAMMGTLKTGDRVTVSFSLLLTQKLL